MTGAIYCTDGQNSWEDLEQWVNNIKMDINGTNLKSYQVIGFCINSTEPCILRCQ
jgi:hypothetical protein